MTLNPYQEDLTEKLREPEGHRALIGGLWDEMGQHQFDYLVAQGLKPHHNFLDVGCGSLRAGVRLVPYLDPGHYHGIDLVEDLFRLGYEREIRPLGLEARLDPATNLAAVSDFSVPFADVRFDMAIAQSVFSHLPINHLRLCLHQLRPHMAEGGVFFATFFLAPDEVGPADIVSQPPKGEVRTYSWQDPYHYWRRDIDFAMQGLGWSLASLGSWNHPRGQMMAKFAAI